MNAIILLMSIALVANMPIEAGFNAKERLKELCSNFPPRATTLEAKTFWNEHNEEPIYGEKTNIEYEDVYELRKNAEGELEKVKVGTRKKGSKTEKYVQAPGKGEYRDAIMADLARQEEKMSDRVRLAQDKISDGNVKKFIAKFGTVGVSALTIAAICLCDTDKDKVSCGVVGAISLCTMLGLYLTGWRQVNHGEHFEERVRKRLVRNLAIRSLMNEFDNKKFHDILFPTKAA